MPRCAVLPLCFVALALAASADQEGEEEACALQVHHAKQVKAADEFTCAVGDHVECPGSGAMCAGNQCCPRGDTGKTFPCPSANPGWSQCEQDAKELNCVHRLQLSAEKDIIYINEFRVKNQCNESVVVKDFGEVAVGETKTFGPRKHATDPLHLEYNVKSWTTDPRFMRWDSYATNEPNFMICADEACSKPHPIVNLPDIEPWYGYTQSSSLVAYKPGSRTPACHDAGAAWTGELSDCETKAGGTLKSEPLTDPYTRCAIPDYRGCRGANEFPQCHGGAGSPAPGQPLPAECTNCPGSVGDCNGNYSKFSVEHTWAFNGDGTWTKQRYECPDPNDASCFALPGYWTTPEQPCWKDQKYQAIGLWRNCKALGVTIDVELTVCNIGTPPKP